MAVTLYDANGRPVNTGDLVQELAAPTLAGIRSIWRGAIASGLTPRKLAVLLKDAAEGDADSFLTLAEEMEERDPHYAGVLGTRKRAVKMLPVVVEAASDAKTDVDMADAVRALTRTAGFRGLIEDLLDALGKGYSVVEIMWDKSARQWMPGRYEWRDPRFFQFDRVDGRTLRLRDETNLLDGIDLAPYKFVAHYPKLKSGIPIRGGVSRLVAWSFCFKHYAVKDWLAFVEVFGMPLRLGRYKSSALDKDIDVLKMAVANLGTDAAAVLPDSMRIEFVEAAKSAGGDKLFQNLAEWIDRQVSKAVLGQTMTTDDGSSLAQAKVHEDVRRDITEADAEQLGETLNLSLVKPFIDLNYGPQEAYPSLTLYVEQPEDIKGLTDALAKLVPLGLKVEQSVIRDKLGLPDPEDGADLLTAPSPQPSPTGGEGASPQPPASRQSAQARVSTQARELPPLPSRERVGVRGVCPGCGAARNMEEGGGPPDELDALVDDTLSDWQPVMSPILDPILKAAEQVQGYDEFMRRLYAIYGTMDLSEMQKRMALATFIARGMGDATDEV